MTDAAIVAEGLSRTFGKLVAVDGIDLTIPSGKIYGFLGPNGSGKTTTIRMLCGLLKPSAGSIRVLGMELPRDAERVRPRIGYMTQKFSLYEDLTVRENMEFMARIYSMGRRRRRERIESNLARYTLGGLERQRAGTLSGGQRQRLALAAVTLHEPELLLLDEPTSAVDPQSRRDFWDGLFELAESGTTILVSTHFMDEAERCHRLAILAEGRLVAEGVPRVLSSHIDAVVLEVETDRPRQARAALQSEGFVRAVTQLGTRLHVMVDPHADDPVERVGAALEAGGAAGTVERVNANLEDVFVAATGFDGDAALPVTAASAGASGRVAGSEALYP
ncbi:MAG: ABC transporter ATP-binding protein [Acidobacteria bacterium]|nr:ABC transporter ATP-binding protein [Acidobacteriota bacterium]